MVEIPENLHCLYSETVTRVDDEFVIEVPAAEIETGTVPPDGTVRVAVLPQKHRYYATPILQPKAPRIRGRTAKRHHRGYRS